MYKLTNSFNTNLKILRGNLSQSAIAEKLNISRSRYAHYESGRNEPDNAMIKKIADYYEITVDELLGNTQTTAKDEMDIAKRMEMIKRDLENSDGLAFNGEPMSEEAIESLLEAMEYAVRTTQKINKKYIPNKYKDKNK